MGVREYLAAAVVAAVFGAGWTARGWKEGAEDAAAEEAARIAQERSDAMVMAIAKQTQDQIAAIRITNKTIVQEVRRETFHEPVYTDCRITADGLQLLNRARAQGGSEPAGTMPADTATGAD